MRTAAAALILLITGQLVGAQPSGPMIVEEVVAVVDRTPLLRSDIDLAELLDLVDRPPGEGEEAYRSALLDARIQLEVQFRDLEASGVLFRLDLDVTGVRRSLLEAVGGLEAVGPELRASGLGDADIDELALRICAVNGYVEQRLRPRVSVGMAEIEAAYQELVIALATSGEPAPPLAEVHGRLHSVITERKLNDEIERWVERALAEREVTRFVR
ncbi:MAG: hypothetical protein MUC56_04665 [Thermoanaerobaculales bacterium]|nr:hypothetical protein [Thermoanaerobaculales bacterium]